MIEFNVCWSRNATSFYATIYMDKRANDAKTKWTKFHKLSFQIHFLPWRFSYLVFIFTCVLRRVKSTMYIGLDNGLTPTRRQAIILTNDGLVHRRIYASLDRPQWVQLTFASYFIRHLKTWILKNFQAKHAPTTLGGWENAWHLWICNGHRYGRWRVMYLVDKLY